MKRFTCIVCPIGCRVSIETRDGDYVISGNRCQRGAEFARSELLAPMRSLTTTVRTVFPEAPVLPVRTKGEVPKEIIPKLMMELSKVLLTERKYIGETLVSDILGTGCDIIVTSDILG